MASDELPATYLNRLYMEDSVVCAPPHAFKSACPNCGKEGTIKLVECNEYQTRKYGVATAWRELCDGPVGCNRFASKGIYFTWTKEQQQKHANKK